MIRLRDARLGYGREPVLEGVNLEIASGEFWFLLGPNGSGKTTILRAILGLIRPQAGEVWRHPQYASLDRIGFVPQRSSISQALPTTVREFVSLGTIGVPREDRRPEDLIWALGRVGLAELAQSDYWSLSGGQRQRALVARALVRRPGLLILDEPTEGMDARSEAAFLGTLDDLCVEGGTLIFVTHHVELARRHATHVALLQAAGIACGSPEAILSGASARALFGEKGFDSGSSGDHHSGSPG